ncbi:MAG: hypothetical protein ABW220_19940 [Burkholderiaceae bacterium]
MSLYQLPEISQPHAQPTRFLLPAAVALAIAVGAAVVSFETRSTARHDGTRAPTVSTATLDTLRSDAFIGDADASRRLSGELLDRYEREHREDDLFEAMMWLERDWNSPAYQSAGLTTRVFEHHCSHPVLRWHWLCQPGE